MSRRYVRREAKKQDTLGAAAVSVAMAIGVGTVVFYLTRILLAREEIGDEGPQKLLDAPRD